MDKKRILDTSLHNDNNNTLMNQLTIIHVQYYWITLPIAMLATVCYQRTFEIRQFDFFETWRVSSDSCAIPVWCSFGNYKNITMNYWEWGGTLLTLCFTPMEGMFNRSSGVVGKYEAPKIKTWCALFREYTGVQG